MPTEDGYDRTWLQDISYDGLKKLARVHGIEDDAEVPDIIEWQYLDGGGKHDREWTCYSPADNEALEKAFQSENVTVVLQVFFAPENPTPKPHTHPRRCCTQNTK